MSGINNMPDLLFWFRLVRFRSILNLDLNGYPLDARCTCDPKYRARFQSREEPFSWARVQVLRWGSVMRLGENRPVELYVRQGDTHLDLF